MRLGRRQCLVDATRLVQRSQKQEFARRKVVASSSVGRRCRARRGRGRSFEGSRGVPEREGAVVWAGTLLGFPTSDPSCPPPCGSLPGLPGLDPRPRPWDCPGVGVGGGVDGDGVQPAAPPRSGTHRDPSEDRSLPRKVLQTTTVFAGRPRSAVNPPYNKKRWGVFVYFCTGGLGAQEQ